MNRPAGLITPDWPAPPNVMACFTTREGGVSQGPWRSLNLGAHVGDDPEAVADNRRLLRFPSVPCWLNQVHSDRCIDVDGPWEPEPGADAAVTRQPGRILAVMVADCLPVLFCSRSGDRVGVAHAGWRGLADGVLEAAVAQLGGSDLLAWLGPAIGPCHYEVGEDVRCRFEEEGAFSRNPGGSFQMNLASIARYRLEALGVTCSGGGVCTYCDEQQFFSYRRDGVTGRMGGFVWLL